MELKVIYSGRWSAYYIIIKTTTRNITMDRTTAKTLNLTYEEYIEILKNYGAYKRYDEHYFKNAIDAQRVVEEILTPLLVMAKLIDN